MGIEASLRWLLRKASAGKASTKKAKTTFTNPKKAQRFLKIEGTKRLVQAAFRIQGRQFYQFVDPLDMPIARFHYCQVFEQKARIGISQESLKEFVMLMETAINEDNTVALASLVTDLAYRVEHLYDPSLIYELASAVFFDLDEDLTTYDTAYNEEKIALFRSEKMEAFFLLIPVRQLFPFGITSEVDMRIFLMKNGVRQQQSEQRISQIREQLN
ncbi:MAG: hypothetical protein AAF734_00050 [Bacteroidota bacterium]